MQHLLRKLTAGLLVAALTLSLTVPAMASEALGEDLTALDVSIHQDTVLSENVFWSTSYSDLREENYITYTPNETVIPIVTYGDSLASLTSLPTIATELEAQGYRVVAGINGDFYNLTNGLSIGLVVSDGEVKCSDGSYYAIGFYDDGTAVLGKPSMSISVDLGYLENGEAAVRPIAGYNIARSSDAGIYMYTSDMNTRNTTGTTEAGVDVICTVDTDLTFNTPTTLTVVSVLEDASATVIEDGQVVLSANNQAHTWFTDALRTCEVGSELTLTMTADEAWTDVSYAVGALYSLVEDGAVVDGLSTDMAPRTAVGQKADGTLVFYTIDGRQSGYSVGASMKQVAQRLVELGCVTALGLDGGGSTTITASLPSDTTSTVVNVPSDGYNRSVSNQIFLVSQGGASGTLSHFYVEPEAYYVLGGTEVSLSVNGVDTNYYPMTSTYTLSTTAGSLDGDTLYTPQSNASIIVTASKNSKTGSAVITSVQTPDTISVTRNGLSVDTLAVTPGDSVDLVASATYRGLELFADATAFSWSVSGGIGVIDAAGKFTATATGSGSITVSAGENTVTLPVTVSHLALKTMEDFESTTNFSASGSGITYFANDNIQQVKFGRTAGGFTYTVGDTGTATLGASYSVSGIYDQLNLWVYGDSSSNWFQIITSDGSTVQAVDVTQLNFDGWIQLSVALPDNTTSLIGVRVVAIGETYIDEFGEEYTQYATTSGTFGLDQLVLSYGGAVDDDTPQITGSMVITDTYTTPTTTVETDPDTGEEITTEVPSALSSRKASLSVTITDDTDGYLAAADVSVYVDGVLTASSYNVNTGALTASPTFTDGYAHRITVDVVDASGNRNRMSWDVEPLTEESAFTDTQDHWAGTYVDFLKTTGVTTGYTDGTFRPDQNITRQEFAVMLYRYLGIDGSAYDSIAMPFADSAQISDYATTAIKTLYSLGIINGSVGSDGLLYYSPTANLSRAQACAMIGRTQANGYPLATVTFTDSASIPSYASDYVATMVSQGVLGGFTDGTFRPNDNITRGQMAKILYNTL